MNYYSSQPKEVLPEPAPKSFLIVLKQALFEVGWFFFVGSIAIDFLFHKEGWSLQYIVVKTSDAIFCTLVWSLGTWLMRRHWR